MKVRRLINRYMNVLVYVSIRNMDETSQGKDRTPSNRDQPMPEVAGAERVDQGCEVGESVYIQYLFLNTLTEPL